MGKVAQFFAHAILWKVEMEAPLAIYSLLEKFIEQETMVIKSIREAEEVAVEVIEIMIMQEKITMLCAAILVIAPLLSQ